MNQNETRLIDYLLDQNNVVSSKELANALKVSPRSIKNYIAEINSLSKTRTIFSSKSGYTINRQNAKSLLSKLKLKIPQNSDERTFYIIKRLLIGNVPSLNLYDICEALFVEYSTIKTDISKMNKAFSNFGVKFFCVNNELQIEGSEKSKRKLISYVLYEETNHKFMNINNIKDSFQSFSVEKLSDVIKAAFNKYHYQLNDFSWINLLLHLSIIIDRIKRGNYIVENESNFSPTSDNKDFMEYFCNQIESEFDIRLTFQERLHVYILLKAHTYQSIPIPQFSERKIVEEEILLFTKELMSVINKQYYVNLSEDNFVLPFALHLDNLLIRAKSGTYIRNPLVNTIKSSCPTVYDIAIYIALEIMHKFEITLNEDEIAYIALHVGTEIERQQRDEDKLKGVLLCPDYLNTRTYIYNELLENFSKYINIIKIISFEDELKDLNYDILISTIETNDNSNDVVLIPPIASRIDKEKIYKAIDRIQDNRKNRILKSNFDQIFNSELFSFNTQGMERDEVIHLLARKLFSQGCVDESFEAKIFKREQAASTAFGKIAVPHSIEMDALKTNIAVAVSSQGFIWDKQVVNIVFLMAINKVDKKMFHDLYEALIKLFSDSNLIEFAKNCLSYGDFRNLICSSII